MFWDMQYARGFLEPLVELVVFHVALSAAHAITVVFLEWMVRIRPKHVDGKAAKASFCSQLSGLFCLRIQGRGRHSFVFQKIICLPAVVGILCKGLRQLVVRNRL